MFSLRKHKYAQTCVNRMHAGQSKMTRMKYTHLCCISLAPSLFVCHCAYKVFQQTTPNVPSSSSIRMERFTHEAHIQTYKHIFKRPTQRRKSKIIVRFPADATHSKTRLQLIWYVVSVRLCCGAFAVRVISCGRQIDAVVAAAAAAAYTCMHKHHYHYSGGNGAGGGSKRQRVRPSLRVLGTGSN